MKLTPQQKAWLRGLEIACGGAIATTAYEIYTTGGLPHDKAGWVKFGCVLLAAATGAVRLYLQKSPLSLPSS